VRTATLTPPMCSRLDLAWPQRELFLTQAMRTELRTFLGSSEPRDYSAMRRCTRHYTRNNEPQWPLVQTASACGAACRNLRSCSAQALLCCQVCCSRPSSSKLFQWHAQLPHIARGAFQDRRSCPPESGSAIHMKAGPQSIVVCLEVGQAQHMIRTECKHLLGRDSLPYSSSIPIASVELLPISGSTPSRTIISFRGCQV
jgi:hypothetical protein